MEFQEEKKELKKLNMNQLYHELDRYRKKYTIYKKEKIVGKLKNTAKLKQTRKKIAFILTAIRLKAEQSIKKEQENEKNK